MIYTKSLFRTRSSLPFVCLSFILFSCGYFQKESSNNQDSLSQEVPAVEGSIIKNYSSLDYDTLTSGKDISLNNTPYHLKMVRYCMNDSAVVNEMEEYNNTIKTVKINTAHNYSQEITLTHANKTIFKKEFSKAVLKGHLGYYEENYKNVRLYGIQYDSASANKLYFTATFARP